jgi:hypothetical protein
MMERRELFQMESQTLLLDIIDLRNQLEELYRQTGPNSSQYINISLRLNALEKEYVSEKIYLFETIDSHQLVTV